MSNPLKSQRGLAFLPVLAAVAIGAAVVGGAIFRNDIVETGKAIQESAKQERSAAAEKEAKGMPGLGFWGTAGSYLKQAGGLLMEGVGRFPFLGETREEKLKREARQDSVTPGASLDALKRFDERYGKERQAELDKAREIASVGDGVGGLGKEDLDAVAGDLGFIDTAPKAAGGEAGPGAGSGGKTSAGAQTPAIDGGGQFNNVQPGQKGSQMTDAGGFGTVNGHACDGPNDPKCKAGTGSQTRSASTQTPGWDNKSGPKGPYYLPTGDSKMVVLVDSCKGPTKPAQTDFPGPGAWGCVPKDDLTPRDRFEIELDTMQKAIEQLKKTDPARAAEMEQARKEMIKKALLIPNVEALPYDGKIKGALMEMLFKSSYEDGERTLKSIEKFKPDLKLCAGCDNTAINLVLDRDGKVTKAEVTLSGSYGDSGGRTDYSSIETAANLAQAMELVAQVQSGGGELSTGGQLEAQNLREDIVQSGQFVTPTQVSSPQDSAPGGSGTVSAPGGSAGGAAGGSATVPQNAPSDAVTAEEVRKHQEDQREAVNDILQSRTVDQIRKEQDSSRVALEEAEKKLKDAQTKQRKRGLTDKEYDEAQDAIIAAKKIIGEQKATQKDLESQMEAQSRKYDEMVDDMIDAFRKRFEERKKKIDENKDLTGKQKEDAKRALDDKLKDIKAHPRAYLEAVGKR